MKQLKTSKDLLDNIGKKVKCKYQWRNIEWVILEDWFDWVQVGTKAINLSNFDIGESNAKEVFLIEDETEGKEVATPNRLKQYNDYKVGDKVKIRQWDDMEKEFWLDTNGNIDCREDFVSQMKEFCWKTLTISSVMPDYFKVRETHWDFSTDMFEKEYIEPINTYSQPPETNMPDRLYGSKPSVGTFTFDPYAVKATAKTTVSYDWWKPVLWDAIADSPKITTSSSSVPKTGGTPKSTQFKILTFKKY